MEKDLVNVKEKTGAVFLKFPIYSGVFSDSWQPLVSLWNFYNWALNRIPHLSLSCYHIANVQWTDSLGPTWYPVNHLRSGSQ